MDETLNYADASFTPGKAVIEQTEAILTPPEPVRKLGVALVGLGEYAMTQLAPALQETTFCKLAGIVTDSASKTAEWKTKFNIPDTHIYNYENFDEISHNADIDIIYVALPNSMHAEYVIRAADAGKHVICEKPMAITVEECDYMIAACKNAGKLLSVGYRLHYDPYHVEAMRMGQEKVFGSINYIHAQHGRNDVKGWRLDKKLAGGGPLMDLGIYCIQAARYVAGKDPVTVKVVESRMAESDEEIEEFLSWEMDFDGVIAKCETSYKNEMDLLHVKADHGWFELSPAYSYNNITGKTAVSFLEFSVVNQQAMQMDDFALSILENKPVKLPGELGKEDVKIVQAIYESMRTGQQVNIEAGEPASIKE